MGGIANIHISKISWPYIYWKNPNKTKCQTPTLQGVTLTHKSQPISRYRPNFAHFDFFGGSDSSNELILGIPFSTSALGVFRTSFIFVKPRVEALLLSCTFLGKADLRGVKAVATRFADLRIFARTSHDRFFARYQRTDETTKARSVEYQRQQQRATYLLQCRLLRQLLSVQ